MINLYISKSVGEKRPKARKWWIPVGGSTEEDIVVVEKSHDKSREADASTSVRLNIVEE